ncbi:uncharacterized protein LOC133785509 [Humulus lupulus]|uniref:uncharacterized protein LOC133785509 n=1 Tax=Humulus lupulus TaxID=3486 RepID=UPI002B412892|nr:uncharacterized protein LOC133785509 [Humulus lupulus]
MAANSQQFGIRQHPNPPPKSVNEVSTSNANQLGQQLAQLIAVVQQLALGQQVWPCVIRQVMGHATDTCPTLFEGETEGVNVVGNFPSQLRQMYYEPFSQTYNLGWHDHPNFCYANHQQVVPWSTPVRPPSFSLQQRSQQNYAPRPSQAPKAAQPPSAKPSTEDLIDAIATNMLQFQQTTQVSIKSLVNQVVQLAASYNRLEAHLSNKLPSQPERNPKENKKSHKSTMSTYVPRPPFPSRLKKFKKEEADKEILETFCKVEGDEKISVGENVSVVLQKKLPPKCKDPRTLTILFMIGNKRIERCMIYLGVLISVMSYSSHASLNLGPLKETGVIVQLANRTNAYPLGVVEDVLVKVDGLVFPADFYILEMGDA